MPGIAKPALTAQDMALIIMTTSLEIFGSKRYPYDLVHYFLYSLNSCIKFYFDETSRQHFIIQEQAHWSHEYANVPKPAQSLGTPVPRQKKGTMLSYF